MLSNGFRKRLSLHQPILQWQVCKVGLLDLTGKGTKGQGTLVTRDAKQECKRWELCQDGSIVQPNVDWFMEEDDDGAFDIMNSYRRRNFARRQLQAIEASEVDMDTLWKVRASLHTLLTS